MRDDAGQPADQAPGQRTTPEAKTLRFSRTLSFGTPPPADADLSQAQVTQRRWEWTWPPQQDTALADTADVETPSPDALDEPPVTYYEMLTGRRDPHRSFFVAARRVGRLVTWTLVLGLPVLLVTIGVVTGQSLETIFFMGIFALIVGLMVQRSLPRTPFD